MATLSSKPAKLDLTCDHKSTDSIASVVKALLPDAAKLDISSMVVSTVSGGITNKLFKVTYDDKTDRSTSVLVRVFGGEGVIDREVENPTFHALTDYLGRPKYLGRFANGRLYAHDVVQPFECNVFRLCA
eukprot:m.1076651 g.1076651  ORF g.1076651 m.1076651 type:complete len:130 (+) comp24247_c1_seq4:146-535(+)